MVRRKPLLSPLWSLLLQLEGGLSTGDLPTPPPLAFFGGGGEEAVEVEDGGEDGGRGGRGDLSGRRGGVGGAVEWGVATQGGGFVGCRGCARGPPMVGRRVLLGVRWPCSTWNRRGTLAAIRDTSPSACGTIRGAGWVYGGAPLEEASALDLYRGVVLC
jgi:hypothetical protein